MCARHSRPKLRTYRATDELYDEAMRVAQERGENLTVAIRRFLAEYVQPRPTPKRHPARRATDDESASWPQRRRAG